MVKNKIKVNIAIMNNKQNNKTTARLWKLWGLLLLLAAGCGDTTYDVHVPENGITLVQPADQSVFDLNDLSEYTFGWNKSDRTNDFVILLSSSPYLLLDHPDAPDVIHVGNNDSYTMNFSEFDQDLAVFGMKAGKQATFYWAVKSANEVMPTLTTPAASEIRSFTVKRLESKLVEPIDRFRLSLDYEKPDNICTFRWDALGQEGNDFSIIFSASPRFTPANTVEFPVGAARNNIDMTHANLQSIIAPLGVDIFNTNQVFWNILNKTTGERVSLASGTLLLNGMLIFIDKRGSEEITYRVTRIKYSDGEEVIWLADNLKATRYPDGSPIDQTNDLFWALPKSGDKTLSVEMMEACGGHYAFDIRMNVLPVGWRLPTREEFEKLYREASLAPGGYNVLKDPVFYAGGIKPDVGHENEWKLNLIANGRFLNWSKNDYVGAGDTQVALHYANPRVEDGGTPEDFNKTIMHDGGNQLWFNGNSKWAPVRAIYGR
jgi:uncharacterized protein (TIGR02145 family)